MLWPEGCTEDGQMEHRDWQGWARGERRGSVFLIQISGIATGEVARALCAEADRTIEDGASVHFMNDWSEMTTFDTDFRKVMVHWGMSHPAKVKSFFILLRSAMVNVGVNMASIPLRAVGVKLTSTTDRTIFEQRLQEALGEGARRRAGVDFGPWSGA